MKIAFTRKQYVNKLSTIILIIAFKINLIGQVPSCEISMNYCYSPRWYTTNNSPCWKQLGKPGNGSIVDFCFINSNIGYYVGSSQSGINQVYNTIDGGQSFKLIYTNSLFSFDNSTKINFLSANDGCIATFKDRSLAVLHTVDGGITWSLVYNSNAFSGFVKDLIYVNNNFVLVLLDGYLIQLKDNFKTSTFVNFSDLNKNLKVGTLNSNNILLVGDTYSYISSDSGKNYKVGKKFTKIQDLKIYLGKYYLYSNGDTFVSSDGLNWTLQNGNKTGLFTSGPLGILSENTYWQGSSLTYDGGCTSSSYSNRFSKIIQVGNQLYAFDSQNIYKFICNVLNINEMPHDQSYLAHQITLPNKNSLTFNLSNLLSINGTNVLGIPLPSCWFDNTNIDFPYFIYFKGTGKAYSFKINIPGNMQAAILSGKLECLKVNSCIEKNNFSNKDVIEVNTKLNENYYLLIDQNGLTNFTVEAKEIPSTPAYDLFLPTDFAIIKNLNSIIINSVKYNNYYYMLTDITGRICSSGKFGLNVEIPILNFSRGIYLLVVKSEYTNAFICRKILI